MKKVLGLATIAGLVLVTSTASALPLVRGVGQYSNTDFSLPSECMQPVLTAYSNADMEANKSYNDAVENAAQVRHDAIVASWDIDSKASRQAAQLSAQSAYQAGVRNAKAALKAAQSSNRMTAYAGALGCGEQLPNLVF